MTELQSSDESPFESIKHTESGEEYWYARELMPLLGYDNWQNFQKAITRAKISAGNVGEDIKSRFIEINKTPKSGGPLTKDYKLDRKACYYIAMNGDPKKEEIALAQAYFVQKTREAEQTKPLTYREQLEKALATEIEREKIEQQLRVNKIVVEEISPRSRVMEIIGGITENCLVDEENETWYPVTSVVRSASLNLTVAGVLYRVSDCNKWQPRWQWYVNFSGILEIVITSTKTGGKRLRDDLNNDILPKAEELNEFNRAVEIEIYKDEK